MSAPFLFFYSDTQGIADNDVGELMLRDASGRTRRHQREYCGSCCSQEPTRVEGDEVLCRRCDRLIRKIEEPVPKTAAEWFAEIRKVIAAAPEWRRTS
jgi:hypothetical protein